MTDTAHAQAEPLLPALRAAVIRRAIPGTDPEETEPAPGDRGT